MKRMEIVKRYLFFLVGLLFSSIAINFSVKADLGTSPISSIPYTLSIGFTPTLGMFTLFFSIGLVILQLLIMRRKFPKQYWLQIPVSLLFSWFIDLTAVPLAPLAPQSYPVKLVFMLISCGILGVGVFMEMVANVVMLPGEAFVNAVSVTYHRDFGKTKVATDCSMILIAALLGLLLYGRLAGVREGSVIAALLIGTIARFLKRKLGFIEKYLTGSPAQPLEGR